MAPQQHRPVSVLFSTACAAVAAVASLLAVTAGIALAGSGLSALVQVDSAYDDMDTGGYEWSGTTYNAHRKVLFAVDDETTAYEFELDADGNLVHDAPVRTLEISLDRHDFEGVAWMSEDTYAFLSEDTGEVIIATVPPPGAGSVIGTSDIVSTFDGGPAGFAQNRGPEGLATDGEHFYVVNELPATMTKFTMDGTWVAAVDLNELADGSGVVVTADGTYLVVSHESRVVSHYSIDWVNRTTTQLATLDLGTFAQAEGIALRDGNDLYVLGEMTGGGQTFAHFEGDIVLSDLVYDVADVNCSGELDIGDAILITQVGVGSKPMPEGCGDGDVNGDGSVDITDALMILQCNVGRANTYCPPS